MKNFITRFSVIVSSIALALGFISPAVVHAATTAPALGSFAGYSLYSDAGITDVAASSHVWGKVGDNNVNHGGLNALTVGQVDSGIIDAGTGIAGDAFTTAYNFLNLGSQTPVVDLLPAGLNGNHTVTPGVYLVGATALDGTLTLNGAGVYIFRSDSSISVSGAGTMVLMGGATACNVFWQIPTSMTISNAGHIEGTIIAQTGDITFASGASLVGRALAHTAITLNNNQITEPTCTTIPAPPTTTASGHTGTLTVVKTVINDNGGTKVVSDFPLFVNGLPVVSGTTVRWSSATGYVVTETNDANYTRTFSGDCDATGHVDITSGSTNTCIITNNDKGAPVVPPVPPLIDVVKTASPLALPAGPGPVTYTYTLRNIGTVPVTNVTMVGDTCSPIVLSSGDVNNDSKLDLNETWVYRCSQTLSETHTNTVVATGWANGISATDIASATVVVGASVVPPLIHVVKTPSVFTLPAGGGAVTYTYLVTNPGTAPLGNVSITDDKCTGLPGRVTGHPGDINHNDLLESNETWAFTCRSNLTQTTTNIGTASGSANGLTARDLALATVVVASPKLPNTGLPPQGANTPWSGIVAVGTLMSVLIWFAVLKKRVA